MISRAIANGLVKGAQNAGPVARASLKREADLLLHSKAARRSGLIAGALVFVVVRSKVVRSQHRKRVEETLEEIADAVVE